MVSIKPIKKIDTISFGKVTGLVAGVFNLIFTSVITIIWLLFPSLRENILLAVGRDVGISYILSGTIIGLIGGFIFAVIISSLYNLIAPRVGYVMVEI